MFDCGSRCRMHKRGSPAPDRVGVRNDEGEAIVPSLERHNNRSRPGRCAPERGHAAWPASCLSGRTRRRRGMLRGSVALMLRDQSQVIARNHRLPARCDWRFSRPRSFQVQPLRRRRSFPGRRADAYGPAGPSRAEGLCGLPPAGQPWRLIPKTPYPVACAGRCSCPGLPPGRNICWSFFSARDACDCAPHGCLGLLAGYQLGNENR